MNPRIGLVGAGRWGANVLHDLLLLECEVAVVDTDRGRRAAADGAGAAESVPTMDDLGRPDAVIIATPTSSHADLAAAALALDVPVLVEKPLTDDPATARRLASIGGDRLFVAEKWRYHAGIEALGRIARSGELGEIAGLRTVRVDWGQHQRDVDSVWNLLPHELSIGREVLGVLGEPHASSGERVGDLLVGMIATLGSCPWHVLEVSSRRPERRREVTLVAERGIARIVGDEAVEVIRGRGWDDAPNVQRHDVDPEPPLLRQLRAFVGHVRGGPPPKGSGCDGAEAVEVVAVLRALAG